MTARSIVITGAEGGIGTALAKALAGENLTLADEDADVRNLSKVQRLADTAVVAFGRIDLWLHCAGRGINREPIDTTSFDLLRMVSINAVGTMHAIQACLPHFRDKGRGQFMAISSKLVEDRHRSPHRFAYTVSKHTMEAVITLMQEHEARGFPNIRLGWVRLPGVATAFSERALHAEPGAVSSSPALLTPEEAARRVLEAVGWGY